MRRGKKGHPYCCTRWVTTSKSLGRPPFQKYRTVKITKAVQDGMRSEKKIFTTSAIGDLWAIDGWML